jgi:hypothetical protein
MYKKKWGNPKSVHFDKNVLNFVSSMCLLLKLVNPINSNFIKFRNTE